MKKGVVAAAKPPSTSSKASPSAVTDVWSKLIPAAAAPALTVPLALLYP